MAISKIRKLKSINLGYKTIIYTISVLLITIITILISNYTYAETSGKTNVSVTVKQGCSVTARNNEHIGTISNGTHSEIGNPSEINIACNGNNLYSVYAIGYSNDEEGNNNLIGLANGNIASSPATEGNTSSWHFKLSTASDGLTIEPAYTTYATIPNSSTLVAKRESSTATTNDSFSATYAAYISKAQPADTYSGKVQYTLFDQGIELPPAMQDFDCSSLDPDQSTQLTDIRDDNIYTVAKLADGKCWMTQNLAIGSNDGTTPLDATNTDISESYTLPQGSTSGFEDDSAQNIYVDSNETYGGYYTWPAATAGANPSSGEASSSICPKGWRLPTDAEFDALTNSYDSTTIQQAPANFVPAGYYSSSPIGQGALGFWWSSTADSSTDAYYLYLVPVVSHFSHTIESKRHGGSIRCVSRSDDPQTIGTMQDVATWGPSLQEGETVEATDVRDGNTYTVSRLKDGKVWMTSNLRLGDSKLTNRTLTSDTSDVSSNLELPDSSLSSFNSKSVYVDELYGGYYGSDIIVANNRQRNSTDSICPKGWRPPTENEFKAMVTSYSSNASLLRESPINLGLIGYITSGSLRETNTNGYYWTSTGTACGENSLYKISINEVGAYKTDGCSPNDGASLRCVMRQSGENYSGSDRHDWEGEGCKPC